MALVAPDRNAVAERAVTAVAVVWLGLAAVAAPVALGLMAGAVVHVLRPSPGAVPLALLVAIHLFDVGVLAGVGWAAVQVHRRGPDWWRSWSARREVGRPAGARREPGWHRT